MSHFVYVLQCADGTLYTGYTTDLARRVAEHNEAKIGAKYTRGRRPVRLVHSETCLTRGDALRREAEIKGLSRKEKLKMI